MGMLVTVVTLYDDSAVEHYVAVVHGMVSQEQRRKVAQDLSAHLPEDLEDEDDQRVVYFREVETCDSILDITAMPNIDGRS